MTMSGPTIRTTAWETYSIIAQAMRNRSRALKPRQQPKRLMMAVENEAMRSAPSVRGSNDWLFSCSGSGTVNYGDSPASCEIIQNVTVIFDLTKLFVFNRKAKILIRKAKILIIKPNADRCSNITMKNGPKTIRDLEDPPSHVAPQH